jgi:hypothetical protein
LQLTFKRSRIDRSAKAAEIVMVANTEYLQRLAIQDEAFVFVEREVSNFESRHITVNDLAAA